MAWWACALILSLAACDTERADKSDDDAQVSDSKAKKKKKKSKKKKSQDRDEDTTASSTAPPLETVAGLPVVPETKSHPPSRAEWNAAGEVNTQAPASRPGACYMKIVREWLKVHCDGRIRGFREMEGFGAEYSDYYKKIELDKQADFVVRLRRGRGMALKIERREDDAQLFVSWPPAQPQPTQVALGIAKRGTPGDNIVME